MSAASSESAQKLLKAHEELAVRQEHNDLLGVMSSPEGRRFVWRLIGSAGVYQQSFAADPMATAFNEGRRAGGLALLVRLQEEAPDLYLEAQREHIAAERLAQQLREAAEAEAATQQEDEES